jgi:hypothetical protein
VRQLRHHQRLLLTSSQRKRTASGVEIGGWLLKANPEVWDVIGHLAAGRVIDGWGVADGYRADLMTPGDRCFVWVTGPRGARWTPGIWAAGVVTARPVPTRESRRLRVGLEVHGLDPLVPRSELRSDPRFAGAEVLRVPRMGNPLILTLGEVAAVDDHLT